MPLNRTLRKQANLDTRLASAEAEVTALLMGWRWKLNEAEAMELARDMAMKARALAQSFHDKGEAAALLRRARGGRAQATKLALFLRRDAEWILGAAQLGPLSDLPGKDRKGRIETLAAILEALATSLGPHDEIKPDLKNRRAGEVIVRSVVAELTQIHGHHVGRPVSDRTISAKHLVAAWMHWFAYRGRYMPVSWKAVAIFVTAVLHIPFADDLPRSLKKMSQNAGWADIPVTGRPRGKGGRKTKAGSN